jgi:transcriptional regulator with XRE-family HTH domain
MYGTKPQTEQIRRLRREGGEWLKKQREEAGLSQSQLARFVGLKHYTFVSQLETGRVRIPPEHYEAWAKALKIRADDFARAMLRYYDPVLHKLLFEYETQEVTEDQDQIESISREGIRSKGRHGDMRSSARRANN